MKFTAHSEASAVKLCLSYLSKYPDREIVNPKSVESQNSHAQKEETESSVTASQTMSRSGRLSSARDSWLKNYNGKNVAAGYRKHFGVDWACAFKELEMLGVKIDSHYKSQES